MGPRQHDDLPPPSSGVPKPEPSPLPAPPVRATGEAAPDAPPVKAADATPGPPPPPAPLVPSIEEILLARGFALEAAKKRAEEIAALFPLGVPAGTISRLVDEFFPAVLRDGVFHDVVTAWLKVKATGQGPVAHATAELV